MTWAAALSVLGGAGMLAGFDLRGVPRLWHVMAALGVVMALAVARIRRLETLNLGLGVGSYAAAAFARMGA